MSESTPPSGEKPKTTPTAAKAATTAIQAANGKAHRVREGQVVSLSVKTPGGVKPKFLSDRSDRAIHCRRTAGSDVWTAAWVAPAAGEHPITVSAPDADPVTITVTATKLEN